MSGHYPGPWKYWTDQYVDDWGTVRASDGKFICQAKDPRCTLFDTEKLNAHRENNTDPWEANARLIAAAPELLEACKDMLTWVNSQHVDAQVIDAMRNAVAKAEGSTND